MEPQRYPTAAGGWRFIHGPIDLILSADGDPGALAATHERAWERFTTVLSELVGELRLLRAPVRDACPLQGQIARRMWAAAHPFSEVFITPMAAVAGAVADEIIACYRQEGIARAAVNNGGDIALHLTPGSAYSIGLFSDLAAFSPWHSTGSVDCEAQLSLSPDMPVRGIATSGWRGRSFSLGIADSVTVLAASAAEGDAAATIVANAVNLSKDSVLRRPACELKDDSDLLDLLVTTHVPALTEAEIAQALHAGLARAREIRDQGHIWNALLCCQGWALDTQSGELRKLLPTKNSGLDAKIGW